MGGPPEEIGHKVAAARVGTFLGILLCYSFVGPVAVNMAENSEVQRAVHHAIGVVIVSFIIVEYQAETAETPSEQNAGTQKTEAAERQAGSTDKVVVPEMSKVPAETQPGPPEKKYNVLAPKIRPNHYGINRLDTVFATGYIPLNWAQRRRHQIRLTKRER